MQVFKVYFKILRKALPSILIYTTIFLGIVLYSSTNSSNGVDSIFNEEKVKVAFINNDENSKLIKGYKEYLSNYCEFVELKSDTTSLKDALFFRKVVYIVKIPKGFTKGFMSLSGSNKLEKLSVPNNAESVSIDMATNRYFQTAQIYQKYIKNINQYKLVDLVKQNLKLKTDVTLYSENTLQNHQFMVNYNNLMSYGLISILVLSVGIIMVTFNKLDLKRRNIIAPMSTIRINLQLILGNFVFTFVTLIILLLAEFIIKPQIKLDKISLYLMLNALIFSIAVLAISFLIGMVVKSKSSGNAIANILSLGMCFISGVFVPQELLNEKLLKIATFTPCYWFVKANNTIGTITDFSMQNLKDIHQYMIIEIGFAAALFAVSLVIGKMKSKEAN